MGQKVNEPATIVRSLWEGVSGPHVPACVYRPFWRLDLAITPFIAGEKDNRIRRKKANDVLPEHMARLPVVSQILRKTAQDFRIIANHLYDMGYGTVNWNLGCPSPMVDRNYY